MNPLPPIIHESWHEYLQSLFDDPKMQMLKDNISKKMFYPPSELVFRVFKMPIDAIKVVIIGQDPYPQVGQAIGLAFAVNATTSTPKTLQVVLGEVLENTKGKPRDMNINEPRWRTLQHWVDQGVFLLNAALTVEANNSGSHANFWIWFTRLVVDVISHHHNTVWLLWGSKAQSFESYIYNKNVVGNIKIIKETDSSTIATIDIGKLDSNFVLKAPHPVAETYNDTNPKFTGCNHFNICNKILKLKGQTEINW